MIRLAKRAVAAPDYGCLRERRITAYLGPLISDHLSRTTYLGPLISFIQLPRRRLLNHRQSTFRRRYAHRSIPSADR